MRPSRLVPRKVMKTAPFYPGADRSTMENANAIWPSIFARPGRVGSAVFADIQRYAVPAIKTAVRNRHDSYVERLVAWRSRDKGSPVPQLQSILERLKNEIS